MTHPVRSLFKRLSDGTAPELAFIATPTFALRQLTQPGAARQGGPAGLLPQQVEDGVPFGAEPFTLYDSTLVEIILGHFFKYAPHQTGCMIRKERRHAWVI